MDKLTLQELSAYLPWGLKVITETKVLEMMSLSTVTFKGQISIETLDGSYGDMNFKPLLHPLSNYTDINSPSMNELNTDLDVQMEICDLANKQIHYRSLSYGTALTCFQNHIDVFGLCERGVAVEIKEGV